MLLPQLLLVALTAIISSGAQGTCPVCLSFTDVSNIELAMVGFDPFMADPDKDPDPGFRGQVFEPYSQLDDGRVKINPFITKAFSKQLCTKKFSARSLNNFNQYLDSKTFNRSISEKTDGAFMNTIEMYEIDDETTKIMKFFQETKGNIIAVTNECILHTIEISDYVRPTFTHSFAAALVSLHNAAKDPYSPPSIEAFVKFVDTFGTHFLKKTMLGSKIIFERRFTRKAESSEEEIERQECAISAAHFSVKDGASDIVAVKSSFSRESRKCSLDLVGCIPDPNDYILKGGILRETVTCLGSFSANEPDSYGHNNGESVPISFELEPMPTLFSNLRFSVGMVNHANSNGEQFNASATIKFFRRMTRKYCAVILGRNCTTIPMKGCGINSQCSATKECVNDVSGSLGYHCHESPAQQSPPQNLGNIALGKPVTGSPAHVAGGYILTPNMVTNGDVTIVKNFYHSKGGEALPFVIVDLGKVYKIWRIRIMPRRDTYYPGHFLDISIRTGTQAEAGPNFSTYSEIVLIPGDQSNPATWIEHTLSSPLCGRYVSVQRTFTAKSGVLMITELEVYAEL